MPDLFYRSGAPIGEIVLNQPSKRNAISASMWESLGEAAVAAERDPGARLVVVRGEGDHFAAGADITEFEQVYETPADADAYTRTMLASLAALEALAKPTLAMIRGACVGGGCSIALACDFRFAARSSRFGVTPGKLGLVYSLADTRRLAAAAGLANAKDLLLTGRLIDGEEAFAMRLCDRLYNDDELEPATLQFARALEEMSPFSARATKEMFALLKAGAADDDPRAGALLARSFAGTDFKEGRQAFLEKRRPRFPTPDQ
jgi:enoyl-CoA hydratase/carnithine racemase